MMRARSLGAAADFLQRFVPRQELRVLVVTELQRILRLHQRVGIEHPLNFGRRDAAGSSVAAAGRGCARRRRRHPAPAAMQGQNATVDCDVKLHVTR